MKAISLYQPWASLIAHGVQTVITAPSSTPHRGALLVCSRLERPDDFQRIIRRRSVSRGLESAGLAAEGLELGVGLVIVNLVDVVAAEKFHVTMSQYPLGDFSPGRFVWDLRLIHKLAAPFVLPPLVAYGIEADADVAIENHLPPGVQDALRRLP